VDKNNKIRMALILIFLLVYGGNTLQNLPDKNYQQKIIIKIEFKDTPFMSITRKI